jgi:bleomycin hydrolase
MIHRLVLIAVLLYNTIGVTAQSITTTNHTLKFTSNLPCSSIKDQYLSSTCWSFGGNSFFESELLKNGKKNIDISEMYTVRFAWLQKIKLHLEKNGLNYLTPGGQFHNIQWVIKNYGMVPEEVYNGKPLKEKNHNHSLLDTAITKFVEGLVKSKKKTPDAADWKYINSLFDKYLGKIPASFTVLGKQYTAITYASNFLQVSPDDYIEIMSFTHHPFYQSAVFENKYNYSFDKYMNVPFDDFVAITDNALQNGYTVLWTGDVTDEGFDFTKGAAFLPDTFSNKALSRQAAFADSSSYMDHLMHIVGLTKDENGHKWYYIKNSWGTNNALNGYMLMDENYFAIKTAAIVVNKKAIPPAIKNRIKE